MKRFQALCLLLPLFLLAQSPKAVSSTAAESTPTLDWKSGQYAGRITIMSYLKYFQPSNPTMQRNDFEIRIKEAIGKMEVNVGSGGAISGIIINVDLPFSYKEAKKAKDDKSECCCLGYQAHASGKGKLIGRTWAPLTPNIGTFTIGNLKFSLSGLSAGGNYFEPKSKCPSAIDTNQIRSSLNLGFSSMFQTEMKFEVYSPTEKSFAGICELPAWSVDTDHVFVCTWYVERAPNKK